MRNRRKVYLIVFTAALFSAIFFGAPLSTFAADMTQQQQPQTEQPTKKVVKVWVNTKSAVYHCPGTRWYGATKNGAFMTEDAAKSSGNRPAYGRACS